MADYAALFNIRNDSAIRNKVAVAATVKAHALMSAVSPTPDEVVWANSALSNTESMASKLLKYVLAANKGLTIAQIQGASDPAIQTNVDEAADALIASGVVS